MKYGFRYWCIKVHLWIEDQAQQALTIINDLRKGANQS